MQAAQAEYDKRRSVFVEDAYGWALHMNGRDQEALVHAQQALRLGTRSALLHFHKGMIEKALGQRDAATADLTQALALNAHFSPLQGPAAREALAELSRR